MKRLTLGGGLLFAVTMFTLAACDSAGPKEPPDPGPQTITLTLEPTHADSTVTQATLLDATADTTLGVGKTAVTWPVGDELNLRVESDTFQTYATTVTFAESSDGQTRPLELAITLPDYVRVAFEIRSDPGDTLVPASVTFQDSLVAENTAEGIVRLPYSLTGGQLCTTESQYFLASSCRAVVPDRERVDAPVELTAERKQVSFQAALVDSADGMALEGLIAVDGEVRTNNGRLETSLYKHAGTRSVRGLRPGYDTARVQVAANQPQDLTLSVRDLPDCSDGISNDGDEWVDEEDAGCVDTDKGFGSYEPEDDNEVLNRAYINGYGTGHSEPVFVSSAAEHQTYNPYSLSFHHSIKAAIGEVQITRENMVEAGQEDETFAVQYKCGPSSGSFTAAKTRTSEIVPDSIGFTGWRTSHLHGFDADFFSAGVRCKEIDMHGTKAREEPAGDGQDDVVFGTPDHYGSTKRWWFFEPEEVPDAPAGKFDRTTHSNPHVKTTVKEVGRRNRRYR